MWTLQTAFVFAEAFILPPLAATAPEFVDAMLGISYGHTGSVNLGTLPTLYSVVGIAYMLGGLHSIGLHSIGRAWFGHLEPGRLGARLVGPVPARPRTRRAHVLLRRS
jgi:hypothetical protein